MLGWPWPPGPPPPPASLPGATPGGSSGTAWIRRISLLAAQGAGADPSGSVPDKVRLILGQTHSGPSGQVSPSLISSPATPAGGGNPFTLGQLPPPGSKGLSSGHWENPSRSPPDSRDPSALPPPPRPPWQQWVWNWEPPPAPSGTRASPHPQQSEIQYWAPLPQLNSKAKHFRGPVGLLGSVWCQYSSLPGGTGCTGAAPTQLHRGFLLLCPKSAWKPVLKTNPALPYRRDPKSRAQCVLRVCHPQSSSRAAKGHVALEIWPHHGVWRSHCLHVRGWLWDRWDTPGAGRGWCRARAAAGDASDPAQHHSREL